MIETFFSVEKSLEIQTYTYRKLSPSDLLLMFQDVETIFVYPRQLPGQSVGDLFRLQANCFLLFCSSFAVYFRFYRLIFKDLIKSRHNVFTPLLELHFDVETIVIIESQYDLNNILSMKNNCFFSRLDHLGRGHINYSHDIRCFCCPWMPPRLARTFIVNKMT